MVKIEAYPDWEFTLAVIRDAINLLWSHRPDMTCEQLIAVIGREYRHPAAGETAVYLAEAAEDSFPPPKADEQGPGN
jgi:hypothetical protein